MPIREKTAFQTFWRHIGLAISVQHSSECLMLTCTCSVVSVSAADDIKCGLNGADNIKLRVKEKVRSRQNQGTLSVWNWLHIFKNICRRLIFKPTRWWVDILVCRVEELKHVRWKSFETKELGPLNWPFPNHPSLKLKNKYTYIKKTPVTLQQRLQGNFTWNCDCKMVLSKTV